MPIDDSFPDDHLFALVISYVPWFANLVSYLACGIVPLDMNSHQRKRFFSEVKSYFWEEPCLYKACEDGLIRRCVTEEEPTSIIFHCHYMPSGGHVSGDKTAAKIVQAGFYWLTLYKDVHAYVWACDYCQRTGGWSRRNEVRSITFLRLKFLMFGVWISWALIHLLEGIGISSLRWIMCSNGWKLSLAPPMSPEWLLGSSERLSFPISKSLMSSLVTMAPTLLRRNLEQC